MADPIVFEGLASRIGSLRESRGLDVGSLAAQLDVTVEWAYDIESYDDEILSLTVREFLNLCAILDVNPVVLLEPGSESLEQSEWVHLSELAGIVSRRVESSPANLDSFEDEAGWFVGDLIHDPRSVAGWCFNRLLDICTASRVDWKRVVPALKADFQ